MGYIDNNTMLNVKKNCMARTTSAAGCEAITFAKALQPLESARQIKENSKTYQNLPDESQISET
jgi:hypothetical protein